jgi:hypothetical protein
MYAFEQEVNLTLKTFIDVTGSPGDGSGTNTGFQAVRNFAEGEFCSPRFERVKPSASMSSYSQNTLSGRRPLPGC